MGPSPQQLEEERLVELSLRLVPASLGVRLIAGADVSREAILDATCQVPGCWCKADQNAR